MKLQMKRDINQKIYIGTSLLRKKKHFFTVQKFIGVVNGVHVPKGRRKKKKGFRIGPNKCSK